jgi:hypothetical protein
MAEEERRSGGELQYIPGIERISTEQPENYGAADTMAAITQNTLITRLKTDFNS